MSKITTDDLARYIFEQNQAGKDVSKKVAQYLVAARRSRDLAAVMRKVAKLREQELGITEATVTSVRPISAATKTHIKSLLGGKKVILNEVIDPSVVGGMRVEGAERGIDLTVENQLKQLKQLTGAKL